MFTCEMFQVFNHFVLISSLDMGFGHRNCVVVGCAFLFAKDITKLIDSPVFCWFSHDVTKLQTSELLILLKCYFHDE